MDVLAFVKDFQRLPVVALSLAFVTRDVDVWQEVHFDLDQTVPLAGFTSPTFDVEAESTWLVTP